MSRRSSFLLSILIGAILGVLIGAVVRDDDALEEQYPPTY